MRITTTDEFLNTLAAFMEKSQSKKEQSQIIHSPSQEVLFKLGTIDPNYHSGRPKIIFEGEDIVSLKAYPYLSSYTPAPNDIVLLAKVSNSYVILGKKI